MRTVGFDSQVNWNRVWSTLEEDGKSIDIRWYVIIIALVDLKYINFCIHQIFAGKRRINTQKYESFILYYIIDST